MARKTVNFTKKGISKLPDDKPAIYKILTAGGNVNYVGSAKRGRVRERVQEQLDGRIPGVKVRIQQSHTIQGAEKTEQRIIKKVNPPYNKKGK